MTSKRLHLLLVTVILLLLLALMGGAYGINQVLSAKSNTLAALKAKSLALQQQQTGLAKAKRDIATYAGLQQTTQAIVPEDKSQAEAVREIVNLAGTYKINLRAITFPASTLGTSAGSKSSGSSTAAPSVTPKVPVNAPTNTLSQLQLVTGLPGVYLLPITVQSEPTQSVPYANFISFLSALEHNRRTSQTSSITIQPDPNNRSQLTFTLTINEYIKP